DANSRPDAEETITYTFEVTNTGNVTLTNLSLSDSLLAEGDLEYVSGDSDEDGDLDVGETWVFTASYTLTQADIDAGQVDNAASVTATDPNGGEATAEAEASVELLQVAELELSKSGEFQDADANSRPDAEETITYTFEVTNTGNVTLTNLSLSDSLLAEGDLEYVSGDSDEDGDLDVGETWVFTASYTLTQADIDAGQVDNAASVTATDPNGGEATAEAEASVELLQVADIAIEKQVSVDGGATWLDADSPSGPTVLAGGEVRFRVIVTNTGNVSLSNVAVIDTDFAFTGIATSLGAGVSDTSNVIVTVAASGQHSNTATVSASFTNATTEEILHANASDMAHYFGRANTIVISADAGNSSSPYVHVYEVETGTLLARFLGLPRTPEYSGGVRIATGDLDGDGMDEIVTAPGRNADPWVYVFKLNPDTGEWENVHSFLAYPEATKKGVVKYRGGVELAIGNVNGDLFLPNGAPKNDIVTAMSYGGNEVRVFLNTTASPISFARDPAFQPFKPFGSLKGGATIRVEDMGTTTVSGKTKALNNDAMDGRAEIIAASGAGTRSTVLVFGYVAGNSKAQQTRKFTPFNAKFRGGASLDVAKVDGDNVPDIIVGASNRGGSLVTVLSGRFGIDKKNPNGTPIINEFSAFPKEAYPDSFNTPVRATSFDSDGDGWTDHLLTYQGTDGRAGKIRKFDLTGHAVDQVIAEDQFDNLEFEGSVIDDFLNAYFVSVLKKPAV
ncbi:MAG: hypothetical protein KJ000_05490, partial [Pirellulaceae bacterium]|nr:hypothetical protein [Pirellulaceae bacterium]